jgi:hypothetical protein
MEDRLSYLRKKAQLQHELEQLRAARQQALDEGDERKADLLEQQIAANLEEGVYTDANYTEAPYSEEDVTIVQSGDEKYTTVEDPQTGDLLTLEEYHEKYKEEHHGVGFNAYTDLSGEMHFLTEHSDQGTTRHEFEHHKQSYDKEHGEGFVPQEDEPPAEEAGLEVRVAAGRIYRDLPDEDVDDGDSSGSGVREPSAEEKALKEAIREELNQAHAEKKESGGNQYAMESSASGDGEESKEGATPAEDESGSGPPSEEGVLTKEMIAEERKRLEEAEPELAARGEDAGSTAGGELTREMVAEELDKEEDTDSGTGDSPEPGTLTKEMVAEELDSLKAEGLDSGYDHHQPPSTVHLYGEDPDVVPVDKFREDAERGKVPGVNLTLAGHDPALEAEKPPPKDRPEEDPDPGGGSEKRDEEQDGPPKEPWELEPDDSGDGLENDEEAWNLEPVDPGDEAQEDEGWEVEALEPPAETEVEEGESEEPGDEWQEPGDEDDLRPEGGGEEIEEDEPEQSDRDDGNDWDDSDDRDDREERHDRNDSD